MWRPPIKASGMDAIEGVEGLVGCLLHSSHFWHGVGAPLLHTYHCILLPLVFVEGLGSQSGENLGMLAMLLKTNGDRVLEVASMLAWLGRWRDYLGGFNTGDLQPRPD